MIPTAQTRAIGNETKKGNGTKIAMNGIAATALYWHHAITINS